MTGGEEYGTWSNPFIIEANPRRDPPSNLKAISSRVS
jgi:hypothetical protein